MVPLSVIRKNVPYILKEFGPLIGNTGIFVKFVCSVTIFGYLLSFSSTAIQVLSVTPGYLLPPRFWLWTAFTHCFLEIHLWEVIIDIITVVLCGKLLEPLWGGHEMLLFFLIVNIMVAVLSGFFYLFLYMCTFNPALIFDVHIHGLAGYIAACSVAVKQVMPDHVLIKAPIKFTNRNVPLTLVFFALFLYLVGAVEGSYATMFFLGFLVSWVYLRFYQPHTNGTKGDLAETFTFACFFPNVIQPVIAVVSNTIYAGLVKVRLCRQQIKKYDVGAPSAIKITLPGTDPQDAERRRQIALKALTDRLQRVESPTLWPAMEEGEAAVSPIAIAHGSPPPVPSSHSVCPDQASETPPSASSTEVKEEELVKV